VPYELPVVMGLRAAAASPLAVDSEVYSEGNSSAEYAS